MELELLAIKWAVEKCRLYLAGTDFTVITDHQTLLGILNRKNLDAINNVRIQRLMAKLLGYSFRVEWIPGKNHTIADTLSRNPVFAALDHKDIIIRQVTEVIEDKAQEGMSKIATADKEYQEVVTTNATGPMTGKRLKTYTNHIPHINNAVQWDSLAFEGIFLTFHGRLVVPEAARSEVLANLLIQYTGILKTLVDACQLYFWPGMTNAIELMISRCKECTACLPSQTLEPQIPTEATRPFKQFSINLGAQKGKDYLIGMDRYSGWPMAAPIPKKADTKFFTDILDDWFIEHRIPVSIRTDGGPQFRDPFKSWCSKHHIRHELASAYHHKSNGHAECAVRKVKKFLAKTPSYEAFRRALWSYRNCPRYNGLSPAQWYVSRRQ